MEKLVLNSNVFGKIEYGKDELIKFEKPILGFENELLFLHIQKEDSFPFTWLQSVNTQSLAFMIIDPFLVFNDYTFEISDKEQKAIQLESPEDALVFALVSIPDNSPTHITANLLAPIVLNIKNKKASQIVLKSEKYKTKTPLLKGGK